jgi:Ca-activated chloride channel family protein
LPDTARHIGLELRNRYVLGYRPTNIQRDGRFHRVIVRIIAPRGLPKLTASWRRGYYAPD